MFDLSLLLDNKIDCIIVDNFLSPDQILKFLNAIKKQQSTT